MKIDRSFFLKKRRADFISGYLKGRIVVAGGLGEDFFPIPSKFELYFPETVRK